MFGHYSLYGLRYLFGNSYIIYILIPLIISMWASARVNSTFRKYSQYYSSRGMTAAEVIRRILDYNGQNDVRVEHVSGNLTDHYDPKGNVIRLSDSVYSSTSVAAIGVAAHEAGHAAQHATGYFPIAVRNALVPVANLASHLAIPLVIIGSVFELFGLVNFAIIMYGAVVLFSLVTLPVEFNASRRAIQTLEGYNIMNEEETAATRKVLSAAAMTYVASTLVAIGSFLRILAIFGGRRND